VGRRRSSGMRSLQTQGQHLRVATASGAHLPHRRPGPHSLAHLCRLIAEPQAARPRRVCPWPACSGLPPAEKRASLGDAEAKHSSPALNMSVARAVLLTGRAATDMDSRPWVTSGRATATPDCAWAGHAHAGEQPHWGHVAAAPVADGTSRYHDWGTGPPHCRLAASHLKNQTRAAP